MKTEDIEEAPSDKELINDIINNENEESLKILSERHLPLCNEIYRRYSNRIQSSGNSFHDVYDDRFRIIWEAISTYKDDKNTKFSTWLGYRIKYQCLTSISKNNRCIPYDPDSLNALIDCSMEKNENSHFNLNFHSSENNLKELKEYVYNILTQLKDDRIKKIFELRIEEKNHLTWTQIGQIIGTSSITAISLFDKGRKIILEKIKSKEIIDLI